MQSKPFVVQLDAREDKDQVIYFLGSRRGPINIDCSQGVAFLLFVSEEGEEELQIASLDKTPNHFAHFTKRQDRIKIPVFPREDKDGKTFYVAKVRFDGYIDCSDGAAFLFFNSIEGREELQIVAPVVFKNARRNDEFRYSERSADDDSYESAAVS